MKNELATTKQIRVSEQIFNKLEARANRERRTIKETTEILLEQALEVK